LREDSFLIRLFEVPHHGKNLIYCWAFIALVLRISNSIAAEFGGFLVSIKVTTPKIAQISNSQWFRYYVEKLFVGSCWKSKGDSRFS